MFVILFHLSSAPALAVKPAVTRATHAQHSQRQLLPQAHTLQRPQAKAQWHKDLLSKGPLMHQPLPQSNFPQLPLYNSAALSKLLLILVDFVTRQIFAQKHFSKDV